jgi:hypothetical protein
MDILAALKAVFAACQMYCTCPCILHGDMGVDVHAHVTWDCYQAQEQLKESLEQKGETVQ